MLPTFATSGELVLEDRLSLRHLCAPLVRGDLLVIESPLQRGQMVCKRLLGLPGAGAADGGMLRLAHLSPDTPPVDVYVESVSDPAAKLTLRGVGYGAVSDYQSVAPGSYTVSMRQAGAAASVRQPAAARARPPA